MAERCKALNVSLVKYFCEALSSLNGNCVFVYTKYSSEHVVCDLFRNPVVFVCIIFVTAGFELNCTIRFQYFVVGLVQIVVV